LKTYCYFFLILKPGWEALAQLTRDQKGRAAKGIVKFVSAQDQHEHFPNCNWAELWLQPSFTLAFSRLQARLALRNARHADDFVPPYGVKWPEYKQDNSVGEEVRQLCRVWPEVARCWPAIHSFILTYRIYCAHLPKGMQFLSVEQPFLSPYRRMLQQKRRMPMSLTHSQPRALGRPAGFRFSA